MTLRYRGMDRAQLDAAYNNTQAVADFPARLRAMQQQSRDLYRDRPAIVDRAYHTASRTRFDFFPAAAGPAPTMIFIHGGYWQNCNKEDFAFVARGPLSRGIHVILAEYTLAPQASMTGIVGEIGLLLDYLRHSDLPLQTGQVCLAGHSAGGHLTALYRHHPLISHAMPLSALVDLQPIRLCWLNDKLSLSDEEVERFSPLRHVLPGGVPTHIHAGGGELSELIRHSRELADALRAVGDRVRWQPLGDDDHFSLLQRLAEPDGLLTESLCQLLAGQAL
ncbi:alpha/beta hydrolase [Pantoea sp. 1.19]|uniref:alpha/beta hydrolase n=1 Tax=Pantoea sp. 1.19 TaxID=1925589 RepID=UPI0009491AE4|nr:alpha/beta hydrolase [Pantoea sp. 1.19]